MSGNPANPLEYATREHFKAIGVQPACGALGKKVAALSARNTLSTKFALMYPLPGYLLWRGNHQSYTYNKNQSSHWGEGDTRHLYHQYFRHAKDPTDYWRAGREFQAIRVDQGRRVVKPLPKPQYVNPKSIPTWNWKSWHSELGTQNIWQRELQYPEHIPEHLGAKRPLANMAPSVRHNRLQAAHIENITITVCPFIFGFGYTTQKAVLDFYRHTLAARTPFPDDRVTLNYTIDRVSPTIDVTWVDKSVYSVPVFEGATGRDYVQLIMERSWLQADIMTAAGIALQPLPIDDYKWAELIAYKKKKDKTAKAGKK